jgi:acetylglutamate kinase
VTELILLKKAHEMALKHGFSKDMLAEAIPYIKKFHGITIVIKYGGSALDKESRQQPFLEDIVFMSLIGMRVILVHGGSRHLNQLLKESRIETKHVKGHRVTCEKTLALAIQAFDKLNDQIAQKIAELGGEAIGLKGQHSELLLVQKHALPELGYVGEIEQVRVEKLNTLKENVIPVITPIGLDTEGQAYNINADIVASRIAIATGAQKLILLTDVDGIIIEKDGAPPQLISSITAEELDSLIQQGVVTGGMKLKVQTGLETLAAGVSKVHIINGSLPHSLLKELLTDKGVGTEILADRTA